MDSALQQPITHLLLSLTLLIAAIIVLGFLYKKFGRHMLGNSRHLKILATLPLGTKEKLILIQVGEEQLLLGATHQSIATLHQLQTPIDCDTPKANDKKSIKHLFRGIKK